MGDVDDTMVPSSKQMNRMRGMRMRPEFLCPISYELFREPYLAADGHTYERRLLEEWIKKNNRSPLTNEEFPDKRITPNLVLKKLIQDLIEEGATGLYVPEKTSDGGTDRVFYMYTERSLALECLGPPEAKEWFGKSFYVGPCGCIGGRARVRDQEQLGSMETVVLKDESISRSHFDIKMLSPGNYGIRDIGSTGGTYIRIQYGSAGRALRIGMIFMLGKHQFTVSSIDDSGHETERESRARRDALARIYSSESDASLEAESKGGRIDGSAAKGDEDSIACVIADAEILVRKLEMQRRRRLGFEGAEKADFDAESAGQEDKLEFEGDATESHLRNMSMRLSSLVARQSGSFPPRLSSSCDSKGSYKGGSSKRIRVTCHAPEQSPLVGQSFIIGPEGASFGRRPTNDITLVSDTQDQNGALRSLDTSLSGEHAYVYFDEKSQDFFLADGDKNKTKASTNGTWMRLSGPNQESTYHSLTPGTEVLISSIRFIVSEKVTVIEDESSKSPLKSKESVGT